MSEMTDSVPDRVLRAARRHLDWRASHFLPERGGAGYPGLLRAARRATGLTQDQAAALFGVSADSWSRWETGAHLPGAVWRESVMRWAFAAALHAARRSAGLTIAQAAARFGAHPSTWGRWETGAYTPDPARQPALLRWIDARLHPKSRTVGRGKA